MTRLLYRAKPQRHRIIAAPGKAMSLRERKAVHVHIEPDWNQNAPVTELSERFKAAMRAKGWLRTQTKRRPA